MNPVLQLFAEPGQTAAKELYMMIFFPILLGIGMFGFGLSKENDGGKAFVKMLGIIPLAAVAVFMWPYFQFALDPVANEGNLIGGSSKTAYIVGFVLPLVLILAFGIIHAFTRFKSKQDTF